MTGSALGLAALLALAGCGGAAPAGPPVAFRLAALDGGELDAATLRGRVVVLHLFDTGITAVIGDTAELDALARAEPRRVAVVGIAFDASGYPVIAPWRRALGLRYLVVLASDAARAGAGGLGPIRTLPTTLILDPQGRVAARIERPLRPGELADVVAALVE